MTAKKSGRGGHLGEPRSLMPGRKEKEIIEHIQRERNRKGGERESGVTLTGGPPDGKTPVEPAAANPAAPDPQGAIYAVMRERIRELEARVKELEAVAGHCTCEDCRNYDPDEKECLG